MSKRLLPVLIVLVMAFSLTACSSQTQPETSNKKNVFVIAHQRDTVYFSIIPLIMREQGLLEKYLPEGVSVEWKNIDVQTDMRDAVVAGQVDIGVLPTSQLIIANSSGIPLVPISDFVGLGSGLYSHHDNIKSVEDITPGDKISSASFGNASHTALQIYCNETFGDAQYFDGNILPMSYADMWASVESSEDLSGALIAFADSVRADESDKLTLLVDLSPYILDNCLGSTALTMEEFYHSNPVFIEAYRKASQEAVHYVNNNQREAAELLTKYWEFDASIIEKELMAIPPQYELSESGFDTLATFMYDMGTLKSQPKKLSEMPNYADIPKIK